MPERVGLKDKSREAEATDDDTSGVSGNFFCTDLGQPAHDLRMHGKMIFVLLLAGEWNFFQSDADIGDIGL